VVDGVAFLAETLRDEARHLAVVLYDENFHDPTLLGGFPRRDEDLMKESS
jgi:hypothetical protein